MNTKTLENTPDTTKSYLNEFYKFLSHLKNKEEDENAELYDNMPTEGEALDDASKNQPHPNDSANSLQSENMLHISNQNYEYFNVKYETINTSQTTVKNELILQTLPENILPNYLTLNKIKRSMSLDIKFENADDIIVVSSSDTDKEIDCSETISSDNDSYHSSDFEFIDENEAKTCGLYLQQNNNVNEYEESGPSSKNHMIPEGNDYLELFQGRYTPYPTAVMENKSTNSRNRLYMECNGVGFNMNMYGLRQIVSDELRNEAAINGKKIRQMYPVENRRRRSYYR